MLAFSYDNNTSELTKQGSSRTTSQHSHLFLSTVQPLPRSAKTTSVYEIHSQDRLEKCRPKTKMSGIPISRAPSTAAKLKIGKSLGFTLSIWTARKACLLVFVQEPHIGWSANLDSLPRRLVRSLSSGVPSNPDRRSIGSQSDVPNRRRL